MAGTTCTALVPLVPPLFQRVLNLFPYKYLRYCFAYGSGVFSQGNASGPNPMVDMIFAVDDTAGFHSQNMLLNPSHYSSLKKFGHRVITAVQEKWPARVYFNTLIPIESEGIMLKYGVVKQLDLINDLYDWDYMYLAGRLHKPVLDIVLPEGELKTALKQNLFNAIHTSLLLLPERFTERELYLTIAALSYNGDFRMVVGENRNKVTNIVNNQIAHFRQLYRPHLAKLSRFVDLPKINESVDGQCRQDKTRETTLNHLCQLPKTPAKILVKVWGKHRKDIEDVMKVLSKHDERTEMIELCLRQIVFNSSMWQSLKGLLTAGFNKSVTYSNNKLAKMMQ